MSTQSTELKSEDQLASGLLARNLKVATFGLVLVVVEVQGLFGPRYFRSSERKFPLGTFGPWNESSQCGRLSWLDCQLSSAR